MEREHGNDGDLECSTSRDFISALADDQLSPVLAGRLDRHLDGCAACSRYAAQVATISRTTRLRPAHVDPVVVERVMERSRPARLGRGGWLRPALAWVGVLVAAQSVSPLVFGELDGAPTHVARHIGASTVALAIGLLYAAWRPHRAFGLLPLVAALFGAMMVGAALDTLSGDRSAWSELVHVSELVGMVLLWMIAGSPGWDRVARWSRPRRALAR